MLEEWFKWKIGEDNNLRRFFYIELNIITSYKIIKERQTKRPQQRKNVTPKQGKASNNLMFTRTLEGASHFAPLNPKLIHWEPSNAAIVRSTQKKVRKKFNTIHKFLGQQERRERGKSQIPYREKLYKIVTYVLVSVARKGIFMCRTFFFLFLWAVFRAVVHAEASYSCFQHFCLKIHKSEGLLQNT